MIGTFTESRSPSSGWTQRRAPVCGVPTRRTSTASGQLRPLPDRERRQALNRTPGAEPRPRTAFRPDQFSRPELARCGSSRRAVRHEPSWTPTTIRTWTSSSSTNEAGCRSPRTTRTRRDGFVRARVSSSRDARRRPRGLSRLSDVDCGRGPRCRCVSDQPRRAALLPQRRRKRAALTFASARSGLRSNLDGLGARRSRCKCRRRRALATRGPLRRAATFSQNDLPLHFGLGERKSARTTCASLWPGGVKQIEMDVRRPCRPPRSRS